MSIEKINIYKIKNTATDFHEFIKTHDGKKRALPSLVDIALPSIPNFAGAAVARAAFKEIVGSPKTANDIPWLSFINQGRPAGQKFLFNGVNKFPSAIVAIKITAGGQDSFYALTFGVAGDSFLDHEMIVHDFGIKVAMNICDENKLKRLQTSIHEAVSTQTERQISTNSNLSAFNVNGEKEFLRMLVGAAVNEYGYIASFKGKESISIKIDKDDSLTWETLVPRLHQLGEASLDTRYRSVFTEYDKFPFVSDTAEIKALDAILFAKIKAKEYTGIHLSPPEFFDYDNLLFVYDNGEDSNKYDELTLSDLIAQRKRKFRDDADISSIKNMKISVYDATSGTTQVRWSAYKCFVAEIERNQETFILSIGQWRRVSGDLQREVSDFINALVLSMPSYLPDNISIWNAQAKQDRNGRFYGENQEAIFNLAAERGSTDLFLFDTGKVEIAGEKKYEVCDLLHRDKKFIQVKRLSSGSASVSHLFVQARFYAEAFLFENKCREGMRQHIIQNANGREITAFTAILPDDRNAITANEYYVCLCLLTDRVGLQIADLPFMSKYELMHTLRYLSNLGLKSEITIRKVIFGPQENASEENDTERD